MAKARNYPGSERFAKPGPGRANSKQKASVRPRAHRRGRDWTQEEAEHACIMGPSGRLIDEKSPDHAENPARDQGIKDALAVHLRDDNTRLPSTVFLVKARRPQ